MIQELNTDIKNAHYHILEPHLQDFQARNEEIYGVNNSDDRKTSSYESCKVLLEDSNEYKSDNQENDKLTIVTQNFCENLDKLTKKENQKQNFIQSRDEYIHQDISLLGSDKFLLPAHSLGLETIGSSDNLDSRHSQDFKSLNDQDRPMSADNEEFFPVESNSQLKEDSLILDEDQQTQLFKSSLNPHAQSFYPTRGDLDSTTITDNKINQLTLDYQNLQQRVIKPIFRVIHTQREPLQKDSNCNDAPQAQPDIRHNSVQKSMTAHGQAASQCTLPMNQFGFFSQANSISHADITNTANSFCNFSTSQPVCQANNQSSDNQVVNQDFNTMNTALNNNKEQEPQETAQFKYQQMQGHFLPAPASMVLNKARTAFVDPIVTQQNKNQIVEVVNQNTNYVLDHNQPIDKNFIIAPPHFNNGSGQTSWNINALDFHPKAAAPTRDNSSMADGSSSCIEYSLKGNHSPQKTRYCQTSFFNQSDLNQNNQPDISDQQHQLASNFTKQYGASSASICPQKLQKILQFREANKIMKQQGMLYCQALKDIQETLQGRELIDNFRIFGAFAPASQKMALVNPLDGHKISDQYRTKMADWMIEVCTSFKCAPKTYFLSVTIMDKFLASSMHHGIVRENQEIHLMGVVSMYLASKYEDVFPLHSKIISDKIAHGAITQKQIIDKEREFLTLFAFQVDFITHYDFYQTYTDKIEKQMLHNFLRIDKESEAFIQKAKLLLEKISKMSLMLIKMSMQSIDFIHYSYSIIVVSSLYASTAFLKHSQEFNGDDTDKFIKEIRKIIFQIIEEERFQQNNFFPKVLQDNNMENIAEYKINLYQSQYYLKFIEKIAIDLVDFEKNFDSWHCGLNQLRKFHQKPFK